MNWFQLFSVVVIAVIIIYSIFKYLNRNKNKSCPACIRDRQKTVDWGVVNDTEVEKDTNAESDLSDDEEEESRSEHSHTSGVVEKEK